MREEHPLETHTGMRLNDLLALAEFSLANNTVLAFRPVNDDVRRRLAEGCCGKGLDVKNKSADQGIALAGLIPVDQAFSKLGTADKHSKIIKYNDISNTKCDSDQALYEKLQETDIAALPKAERQAFEDSLQNLNITAPVALQDDYGRDVYGFKVGDIALKDEDDRMVFCVKKDDGTFILEGKDTPFNPPEDATPVKIEALAYRNLRIENNKVVGEEKQKITADYDQLFFGTKLDGRDPVTGAETVKGYDDMPHRGYATDIGFAITEAIGKDVGQRLITHGPEVNNPNPEELSDGVYTIFRPDDTVLAQVKDALADGRDITDLLLSRVGALESETDILNEYNRCEADGYHMSANTMWGWKRDKNNSLEMDEDHVSCDEVDRLKMLAKTPSTFDIVDRIDVSYRGYRNGLLNTDPGQRDSISRARQASIRGSFDRLSAKGILTEGNGLSDKFSSVAEESSDLEADIPDIAPALGEEQTSASGAGQLPERFFSGFPKRIRPDTSEAEPCSPSERSLFQDDMDIDRCIPPRKSWEKRYSQDDSLHRASYQEVSVSCAPDRKELKTWAQSIEEKVQNAAARRDESKGKG